MSSLFSGVFLTHFFRLRLNEEEKKEVKKKTNGHLIIQIMVIFKTIVIFMSDLDKR